MPYGTFLDSVIEALDIIGNVLMPVAGGLISYYQMKDAWREKRIREFGMATEFSPEDRGGFADDCLKLYSRQYAGPIANGEVVVRHLIYPRAWMQPADRDDFLHLTDLPVEITRQKWERQPPYSRFLPYPREGFAANKKDVQSGQSLLFNGRLFALKRAEGSLEKGDLRLQVKQGGYFDFLDTCEYLGFELAYLHRIRRRAMPTRLHRFCGLTNRWRQADILDLDNRFAGIGINTATLLYNVRMEDGSMGSFILMHQRSGRVAEGIGALHVIPAGSYQPVGLNVQSDFNADMANTVYREFGEELLGVDEFFHLGEEEVLDSRFRQWEVLLLGLGIEPYNTKIEVLTALRVDLQQPGSREMFGGSDRMEDIRAFLRTNYEGELIFVPLHHAHLRQYMRDPRTTPPGKEILAVLLEHEAVFGIL